MKILVTGANGYIGSKVVKQLCDDGAVVIATDLTNENIDNRAVFIKANVFENRNDWMNFFENPDICLHLAWRDGFIHNSDKHILDLPHHYSFIVSLINGGLKKIVSMGSMHEIGYWEGAIDENTPCRPLSQYGIAKNALRQSIELYANQHACIFQWLRAYYIYGDDSYGNSIFCKIRQAVNNGDKLFPFTSGKNKYDFIHINELAKQISHAVLQNEVTGIINVCSGKPISLSEKVEWYISSNKLPIKLDYGKFPDRPYDSPCVFGNSSKIEFIERMFEQRHKKVLITGAKGQFGFDCLRELNKRGYANVRGIDIDDLDITHKEDVLAFFNNYKPDIVIHCAAWTEVDKAELSPEAVYLVNSSGTKNIAEACNLNNSVMVFISTDYVFDGKGHEPFEINSPKNGLSVYGKSKAIAEDYVLKYNKKNFIVRISWAFGINGKNFVKTMLKLAKDGKKEVNVVCDQIGSVTYTVDLAKLICDMIETNKFGVYHATNEGYLSWAEFASKIFNECNLDIKVNYLTTEEYKKIVPQQANRPLNSRMSKSSLDEAGFNRLPYWTDALCRFLTELGEK